MSDHVDILLHKLPPYKGDQRLVNRRQDTFDIIRQILKKHSGTVTHYDQIAINHWKGDVPATARGLYDFLKRHTPYRQEPTLKQTTKTPAAILEERKTFGNDCKHYASYVVGVGEALNRLGFPVKCFYRFASYNPRHKGPGHVFGVFVHNGREIWIDPVPEIAAFDDRAIKPVYTVDKLPPMSQNYSIGSLYDISGIDNRMTVSGPYAHHARLRHYQPHHGQGMHTIYHHGHGMKPHMSAHMAGGHWLDEWGGESVGKGKKKHGLHIKVPKIKIKAPHIKIQPGKLLKKISLAPSRNAYMGLVKLNVFNLAVQLHNKVKKNKANWQKLHDFWEKKLGGNMNKLSTAIDMGVKMHNKLHPNKKVSGDIYDEYWEAQSIHGYDGIGTPVAIPALLAAAAPVIAALKNLMGAFGVKHDAAETAADNADQDVAASHNEATTEKGDGQADVKEDGSVDHGEGVTTKVSKDPATGQQTVTYDVKDPTTHGTGTAGDDGSGHSDDDGDKIATHEDADEDKVAKHHGGMDFKGMLSNVTAFVSDHKYWFIGGTVFIAALFILPKVLSHKPKRRK